MHRRRRGYGLTLVLGEEVAVLQPHGAHKRCFVAPPRAEQGYTKAKHSQPSENGRTVNDEPHACPTATPVQRPRLFQGHYSLSNRRALRARRVDDAAHVALPYVACDQWHRNPLTKRPRHTEARRLRWKGKATSACAPRQSCFASRSRLPVSSEPAHLRSATGRLRSFEEDRRRGRKRRIEAKLKLRLHARGSRATVSTHAHTCT